MVVAKRQAARSFELRAALALAKLYQSTSHPVEAQAVLARSLDGFTQTREMPELAEAEALLAALAEADEVKAAVAQRERRLHLQTAYGQAMMFAKGFIADETKAAFAHATQLAASSGDFSERFAAAHGLWTFALVRGVLRSARQMASAFLREAEDAGRLVEAGVARRGLAIISFGLGEFAEARTHCERALTACDPERDREARERFSEDTGLTAMSWLASTMWQSGEVDRARELIETANQRAAELGHVPSMAHPLQAKFFLEFHRGDAAAALAAAEALEALSRQHGMANWRALAQMRVVWARCRLDESAAGATDLQPASEAMAERGWFYKALLAERELRSQEVDGALARIDEALALAREGEVRSDLPFAHLLRGEILLKRDPANPAPAEEAFETAIDIAKEQVARSWGLRAALSLAKLYQSTGRPAKAHDVLAAALEGFLPTPEMPEIAEAQALLATLAETEEVKVSEAQPQRRLHLQTAYGQAMMWAKGFSAEETRAAFSRDGAHGQDRQLCRPLCGGPLSMGPGLYARRIAVGAGAGIGLSERSGGHRSGRGNRCHPPRPRPGLLPSRRFPRGAHPLRASARGLRP
jgi:tetratricopeptide (TPR) repeat protein